MHRGSGGAVDSACVVSRSLTECLTCVDFLLVLLSARFVMGGVESVEGCDLVVYAVSVGLGSEKLNCGGSAGRESAMLGCD